MIREMKITDYRQAWEIWNRIECVGMRALDDSIDGIAKFLARNPSTCFVAEKEGEVIGTILCGHDGRRAYIYHLAVLEPYRRNEIRKALVKAAEMALQKEGIHKAALVVYCSNEAGNDFWERLDYIIRDDLYYRNKSLNAENK